MAQKYKLHAKTKDGKQTPCAFFLSGKGCRNGDSCKFSHSTEAEKSVNVVLPSEVGSVVSSESGGEVGEEYGGNPFDMQSPESEDRGTKRKHRRGGVSEPFPKASSNAKDTPQSNKKAKKETGSKKSVSMKEELKSVGPVQPPIKSTLTTGVNFRTLNLPIANFTLGSASDHARSDSSGVKANEETAQNKSTPSRLPLPTSTELGRKWLPAVKKTQEHPRFAAVFDFEKCIQGDELIGGRTSWIKAKPFGDWCKANPQVIAIDCEMCATEDPVSKKRNDSALCRISIIDANTDEVLLNSLVKPEWPVVDYRTWINGITEESLANVQFTVRHAQAFMMALCSEETVIAGHAIQNDLKAMRMEHYCVADSSYLFRAIDSDSATVSLKDLAFSVMKTEMPKIHDSVNDARAALRCLELYVENDGKVEPIARRVVESNKLASAQLFIHRIPKHVQSKHLTEMFLRKTNVVAESVKDIEFSGLIGKTTVTFPSAAHACLAFNALEGEAVADPTGKLQKKVYLRGGEYVRVRKMLIEKSQKLDNDKSRRKSEGSLK